MMLNQQGYYLNAEGQSQYAFFVDLKRSKTPYNPQIILIT